VPSFVIKPASVQKPFAIRDGTAGARGVGLPFVALDPRAALSREPLLDRAQSAAPPPISKAASRASRCTNL
jgi:hypothetical protein